MHGFRPIVGSARRSENGRAHALSLTSQIKDRKSYVRRFIDTWLPELPDTARAINRRLKNEYLPAPPQYSENWRYMTAGTAADYRIRAFLEPRALVSELIRRGLEAVQLARWYEYEKDGEWRCLANTWRPNPDGSCVADSFEEALKRLAAELPPMRLLAPAAEDRLVRFCYIVGLLDAAARVPFAPATFLWENADLDPEVMLARVPDDAALDVGEMTSGFLRRSEWKDRPASLFVGASPAGAPDVGNADFDFVADGTLFDLKATRDPKITTQFLRQLAGYWLLDYEDDFAIRSVAIALLRHNHVERLRVAEDLFHSPDPVAVRALFRKGAEDKRVPRLVRSLKIK